MVQYSTVQYSAIQYSMVWYSTVVMLKNSFQFIVPRNPLKLGNQSTMSLYHAVMYCTKGVRGQKVPMVPEFKR